MENLKIKVNSVEESKEAQELLVSIGGVALDANQDRFGLIIFANNIIYSDWLTHEKHYDSSYELKEITLPQLRDMVVLKRNDPKDATHSADGESGLAVMLSGVWYGYNFNEKKWELWVDDDEYQLKDLKPIEKEMKEYLTKMQDGSYKLTPSKMSEDDIEVPEGADIAVYPHFSKGISFFKDGFRFCFVDSSSEWESTDYCSENLKHWESWRVAWQRETLNDKVASAEVARQELKGVDNVNNPSHYNRGGVECIDAIQSSMTKEAFCGYLKGNVQKYMWRYENKGGVESLQKAQWYLNKLIEVKAS